MKTTTGASLLLSALILISACSGSTEQVSTDVPVSRDGPDETDVARVDAEEPGPEPTATAEPTAVDVAVPGACQGILLEEGGELPGEVLAPCLGVVIAAQGPTRLEVEWDDTRATGEFTYTPSYASSAEIEADLTARVYIDESGGWVEGGGVWTEAVEDGTPEQHMAYAVTELTRAAADVRVFVEKISAVPAWDILTTEDVTRPDGVSSGTWRLQAAEPFPMGPVTVEEMVLWIDDEFHIVQQTDTSSMGDIVSTGVSRYYDWGADIEFTPPVG